MTIPSRGTDEFWRLYHALPPEVRSVARKNYRLWTANAFHPLLLFKSIGKPNWSARIGDRHRAIGKLFGEGFHWEWIGIHGEYDKRF